MNRNIAILIPAYNESVVLRKVVEELLPAGYTIIIIDDGSETPMKDHLKGLPVIVLEHPVNLGQGAALQTGLDYLRNINPDIVITFDGDGQHDANDIPKLIEPIIKNETDVTLGSRFLPEAKTSIPFSKKIVLQIARFVNLILSGVLLSDAHNGLRAFNNSAWRNIRITENRMAHASEILFEIRKHCFRIIEVPVNIHYSSYSKNKGQSAWDSIKVLFDLVLHKLFK